MSVADAVALLEGKLDAAITEIAMQRVRIGELSAELDDEHDKLQVAEDKLDHIARVVGRT